MRETYLVQKVVINIYRLLSLYTTNYQSPILQSTHFATQITLNLPLLKREQLLLFRKSSLSVEERSPSLPLEKRIGKKKKSSPSSPTRRQQKMPVFPTRDSESGFYFGDGNPTPPPPIISGTCPKCRLVYLGLLSRLCSFHFLACDAV